MTQTLKRTGFLILAAALALGPTLPGATRFTTSEVAGHATVTVADTITSTGMLAEVAAAGVSKHESV